jgi:hypothetical protein
MPTTLNTYSFDQLEPKESPELSVRDAVKMGASLTLAKGTLLGKRTSDNKHYAYNDALTDGTNVATCILLCAIKTDASGNVYFGDSATAAIDNLPHAEAPVYIAGIFDTDDLTGYDANGKTDLGGHFTPAGWLKF